MLSLLTATTKSSPQGVVDSVLITHHALLSLVRARNQITLSASPQDRITTLLPRRNPSLTRTTSSGDNQALLWPQSHHASRRLEPPSPTVAMLQTSSTTIISTTSLSTTLPRHPSFSTRRQTNIWIRQLGVILPIEMVKLQAIILSHNSKLIRAALVVHQALSTTLGADSLEVILTSTHRPCTSNNSSRIR